MSINCENGLGKVGLKVVNLGWFRGLIWYSSIAGTPKEWVEKSHKSVHKFKKILMFQEKIKKLPGFKPPRANHCIKMDESKVVDTLDIEDMGDKVQFENIIITYKFCNFIFLFHTFIISFCSCVDQREA